MEKKKTIVHFCEKCGIWRGNSKKCPECGSDTIPRELSSSRGDFYFIPGQDKPFPRVTNIIRVINSPGLNYWTSQQAVLAALENPLLSVGEAMAARFKKRDKKGNIGTGVHGMIEALSRGEKIHEDSWKSPYMQAYKKLCHDIKFKVKAIEKVVYSTKYGYAGKLDAIVTMQDEKGFFIWDWKTSGNIYDTVALQLTAYKHALAEMRDDKSILDWGMTAIHLKPNETYSLVNMPDKWKEFQAALTLHKWQS